MRIDANVKFSVHDRSVHNQCKSLTAKPPQPEYQFIFSFHDIILATKCYKHCIWASSIC